MRAGVSVPRPRIFTDVGVFDREGFLPPARAAEVIAAAACDGGAPTEIFSNDDRMASHPEVRRVWEVALTDETDRTVTAALDALRPELELAFDLPLGGHEGIAALRYPPGAFYLPHRDCGAKPSASGPHRRAVSVVIFVNGASPGMPTPFDGGHLRLYECLPDSAGDAGLDMEPEAGTLVAFRSDQLHEVMPVTRGERYTLVTWFGRR